MRMEKDRSQHPAREKREPRHPGPAPQPLPSLTEPTRLGPAKQPFPNKQEQRTQASRPRSDKQKEQGSPEFGGGEWGEPWLGGPEGVTEPGWCHWGLRRSKVLSRGVLVILWGPGEGLGGPGGSVPAGAQPGAAPPPGGVPPSPAASAAPAPGAAAAGEEGKRDFENPGVWASLHPQRTQESRPQNLCCHPPREPRHPAPPPQQRTPGIRAPPTSSRRRRSSRC